jgi:hypothetical protein
MLQRTGGPAERRTEGGTRKSRRGGGVEHMECIHVVVVGSSLLVLLLNVLGQLLGHWYGGG